MDLALNKVPMEGYTCPLEATFYQEETQESIVPDACPDIQTIVATEGCATLLRKESMEGKGEASGCVRVTVLYLPDGEEGLRRLELELPFRTTFQAPGLTPGCPLVVVPRVVGGDTRMLNPRKVLCRIELAVFCQAWTPWEESLCAPWEGEGSALQQRTQEVEVYTAMAVTEKTFAFSDDVNLTASHPAAAEVLGHRLELRCSEAKVIGNKLIIKGEVTLQIRYRTDAGVLATARWDLPFSQIMEVNGIEEEGSCTVEMVETGSEVACVDGEEGRTFSVRLELLAQAVIRQSRRLTLFSDAYSVTEKVTVERQSYLLSHLWEENSTTQTIREMLEVPEAVRNVEDCFFYLGMPQVTREDQEGVIAVQGKVTVLYTSESGRLGSLSRDIPVSVRVALPEGGSCRAKCALGGDIQAVATGLGIEIRCPVKFSYLTTINRQWTGIVDIQTQEREEGEARPSVILRLAQPGECLWDIAKAYSTTTEDILAANELSDPENIAGSLLLIPKSR